MAPRDEIVAYANELLEVERWPEYAPAGDPGRRRRGGLDDRLRRLVLAGAVRARGRRSARELILVHHGLFWRNEPLVVDARLRGRLEALFRAERIARRLPPRAGRPPEARKQRAARRAIGASRSSRSAASGAAAPSPRSRSRRSPRGSRRRRTPAARLRAAAPSGIQRVAISTGAAGHDLVQAAARASTLSSPASPRSRACTRRASSGSTCRRGPPRDGALRRPGAHRAPRRALRARLALRRGREPCLRRRATDCRASIPLDAALRSAARRSILGADERFREAGPLTPATSERATTRARPRAVAPAGFFVAPKEERSMANHLTPEELAKELDMDRTRSSGSASRKASRSTRARSTSASSRPSSRRSARRRGRALAPALVRVALVGPSRGSLFARRRYFRRGLRAGRVFLRASRSAFFGRVDAFAAATLALNASIRSTTGAGSATGSGSAIDSPRSFASSIARRSRR